MALAVSDMEIYSHVTPAYLQSRQALLDNAQLIVFDTNIPAETIAWLAKTCQGPPLLRPGFHRQGGEAPPRPGQAAIPSSPTASRRSSSPACPSPTRRA